MKKIDLNNIDWKMIQCTHDNGIYFFNLPKMFGISKTLLLRAVNEGFLLKRKHKRILSKTTKEKISVKRSKYLKENPDKHPWKKNNKFKSKPCEILKNNLLNVGVIYIEEYQPSDEKYYSIDIAFPNKKIGIEINGNQHYNNDGTLKQYYIKRNEYLKEIGWTIIDVHYSIIYNSELLNILIEKIKNFSLDQDEINFYKNEYFLRKENKKLKYDNDHHCILCGNKTFKAESKCRKCTRFEKRKVIRPSKEELINLLNENNWCKIGRMFGVSDNAIRRWAKDYKIIN